MKIADKFTIENHIRAILRRMHELRLAKIKAPYGSKEYTDIEVEKEILAIEKHLWMLRRVLITKEELK